MKLFRPPGLSVGVFAALLLFPLARAFGCACCANAGEYRLEANAPVGEQQRELLGDMKFDPAARLFMTEAGEDAIKGLASISADNTVTVTSEPRRWRFTFRTAKDQVGTLTVPKPPRMTSLAADLHDSKDTGTGPALYKEWRCEGPASGDGIFEKGFSAPARYTLILQGRGNRCDSIEQFTHWRLEISGKQASYAFFGKLLSAGGAAGEKSSATPAVGQR
jgi:hypothetical protein